MMNADEARKLTADAKNARSGVIAELVKYALAKIEVAAKAGKASVSDPVSGTRGMADHEQKQAAYDHLKTLGYKVEFTSNQRDGDDWTVSW